MANTNTGKSNKLQSALSGLPVAFQRKIIDSYLELKHRHFQAKYSSSWDSSGLSAGKFCEAVLRFLQQNLTEKHTPFGKPIPNFADECNKLTALPKDVASESLRVIMPRALLFVYTLRNKRGIGHVGGDVEANEIDAAVVARTCDWLICELIRIFHSLSLEEAQAIVDSIATRFVPHIWEVGGKKRVLLKGLTYKQQTMLILYSEIENGMLLEDIFDSVEHSNQSAFKKEVLRPLHKDRLVEWNQDGDIVSLSPLGIRDVEETILKRDNK